MRNTTTFWVSGGRLQRSMVLKNPSLCLLHLPEPLPRAISPLASSSSSSSAPLPLLCRLSLSAEPPHHTVSPRPPLRLSPSLSSSAVRLPRLSPALASSASPATLPMPSVAPACQWRLGALSVSACVNRRSVKLFVYYVVRTPPLPHLLPFFSLRKRHCPSLFLSIFYLIFCWVLLFLSQSGYETEKECWIPPVKAHVSSFFPSSAFDVTALLFSGVIFSHCSLHAFSRFHHSRKMAIRFPSGLFSSSPIPQSLPTYSLR